MQLTRNIARLLAHTASAERVLDVGGAHRPLPTATHTLDALPYSDRGPVLVPDVPQRFSAANWLVFDMCERPWPYPDKYFDFSFCAGTLEDVRDPIGACHELMRVSRAGYIETPSRLREVFHERRGYLFRRIVGRKFAVGWGHHRWFCELEGDGVRFLAKTLTAVASRRFFITRAELGRTLTEEESAIGLFWQDRFGVREWLLIKPGETEAELARFKRDALRALRSADAKRAGESRPGTTADPAAPALE
jgi:Methyltransferase domain